MATGITFATTFPTSWHTAQSERFWVDDLERQVHLQLLIGRPDGYTWQDMTDHLVRAEVELGDVSGIGTGETGADAVVRRMVFTLHFDGTLMPVWADDVTRDESYVVGADTDVIGSTEDSAVRFIDRLFGVEHLFARDGFSPRDGRSRWNYWGGYYAPLLKANREVALRVAVTPPGETPNSIDWVTLFQGMIDRTSTSGSDITVQCRDLAKRLMYTYIYEAAEFGDDVDPVPAATVIQQILNRYIKTATPILYVPKEPPFKCSRFRVQYESVWDAIQKVAAQFGWFVGYRWVPFLGEFRLVLMEPPRLKNQESADFRLTHVKHIFDHTDEIGDEYIRNVAVVRFTDRQTGERKTVVFRNEASIAEWEERAMEFSEGELSLIDTEEEALALGQAAVMDLGEIVGTKRIVAPLIPTVDVFSGLVAADPRISSTEDFVGVISVRHVIDIDSRVFETEIVGQSRVVGGYERWKKMMTRPGASPPVRSGDIEPEAVDPSRLAGPLTPDWQSVQIDKSQNAIVIRDRTGQDRTAFGNIQGYPWGSKQLVPDTYGMWGNRAGLYLQGYARLLAWGYAQDEQLIDVSSEPNLANPAVLVAPKTMLTFSPQQPGAVPNIYTDAVEEAPGKFRIKAKTIIKGAYTPLPGSNNDPYVDWVQPTVPGPDGRKGVQTNFFQCRIGWFASGGYTINIQQYVTNEFDSNGNPINWKLQRSFSHRGPLFGAHNGDLYWDLILPNSVWAIRVVINGHRTPLGITYAMAQVASAGYRSDVHLDIDGNQVDPDEPSGMSVMYIAYDQG